MTSDRATDRPEDRALLQAEAKKLRARATELKMVLHDLAEELPTGWESIPTVAAAAFEAHKAMDAVRRRLAALDG